MMIRCLGKEGLIFLPTGEDLWFTGSVFASRIDYRCELIDVTDYSGRKNYVEGRTTVDIEATCIGIPEIQVGKPELVQELSVNELLRRINRRLKER